MINMTNQGRSLAQNYETLPEQRPRLQLPQSTVQALHTLNPSCPMSEESDNSDEESQMSVSISGDRSISTAELRLLLKSAVQHLATNRKFTFAQERDLLPIQTQVPVKKLIQNKLLPRLGDQPRSFTFWDRETFFENVLL